MTKTKLVSGVERALLAFLYAVSLTVAWTVAGVHIALGLAAFLAVVHGMLTRRWPVARTPADSGWVALALASVLAALFAIEGARSFVPLKKLALIPLVHVAAAAFSSGSRARWGLRLFVWGITLTVFIVTLEYLLRPHSPEERLRGTTHYMTFAGLILLALPLAFAATVGSRGRLRALYVVCCGCLGLGLLLTLTRGAWLGAVVAACVIVLRVRRRLVLYLLPALLLTVLFLPEEYRARALSSFDPSHPTNLDRQRMWRAGIEIWRDHPWTGVGLGDLKPVYRDYAPPDAGRIHGHLHSNWVQILASMGIVGILAFVWLMLGVGRLIWLAGSRASDPETRALILGAWGSFWGFHTMGLFEWNFGDVEVTIALYFMLGCSWAASGSWNAVGGTGTESTSAAFH